MKLIIIETPSYKRLLTDREYDSQYLQAKTLFRQDGSRGRLSIALVACQMGVDFSEAAHRIRLSPKNIDYIEV